MICLVFTICIQKQTKRSYAEPTRVYETLHKRLFTQNFTVYGGIHSRNRSILKLTFSGDTAVKKANDKPRHRFSELNILGRSLRSKAFKLRFSIKVFDFDRLARTHFVILTQICGKRLRLVMDRVTERVNFPPISITHLLHFAYSRVNKEVHLQLEQFLTKIILEWKPLWLISVRVGNTFAED